MLYRLCISSHSHINLYSTFRSLLPFVLFTQEEPKLKKEWKLCINILYTYDEYVNVTFSSSSSQI